MKKLILTALLFAGVTTLGACATLSPEEAALRKTERLQEQAKNQSFEDLKKEMDLSDFSQPQ